MDDGLRTRYEIVVEGRSGRLLDAVASGFEVAEGAGGRLRLTGPVTDQAALIGLLSHLQDLRFEVVEVRRVA